MLEILKKLPLRLSTAFCLGCLTFLAAVPAPAQEQTPKSPPPPPPPAMRMPQPAPAPESMPREQQAAPPRYRKDEALEKKKVTDKVGGQEIRAKQGEEDK